MTKLADYSGRLRQWVKARDTPSADRIYRLAKWARAFSVPMIPALHGPLYQAHRLIVSGIANTTRALWYTPLFQSRLQAPAPRLYLYGGLPLVLGNIRITIGADCRVAGKINISGRTSSPTTPELIIGDNCDIGWGSTIAVGRLISIGNNVRLAANVQLAGYPGHPLDAVARARGEPETDDQVGDIILEDDVWLATGTTVLRGVRIGRGTIVGAGSVVTKDLPSFALAAGVPARVITDLGAKQSHQTLPSRGSPASNGAAHHPALDARTSAQNSSPD